MYHIGLVSQTRVYLLLLLDAAKRSLIFGILPTLKLPINFNLHEGIYFPRNVFYVLNKKMLCILTIAVGRTGKTAETGTKEKWFCFHIPQLHA